MRKIFAGLAVTLALLVFATLSLVRRDAERSPADELRARYARKSTPSVDHSLFPQLKRSFAEPQQVTEACISCHNGRAEEVMRSSHWNHERGEYIEGRGVRYIGKRNVLNNYCIGVAGSRESCNKCHIGFGWGDEPFDLRSARNVDCLSCHDASGTYLKKGGGAGYPDASVNLTEVATHVGRPQRTNCGTCHFFGGGGNNVKHGDLDMAQFDTTRDVDVHMASDGGEHVVCRLPQRHEAPDEGQELLALLDEPQPRRVRGVPRRRAPREGDPQRAHPEGLLPDLPHPDLRQGQPHEAALGLVHGRAPPRRQAVRGEGRSGRRRLHVHQGLLRVGPEREARVPVWFNGTASHYLLGDRVESVPVPLNRLHGRYDEPDSKIVPAKVHRARQPWDEEARIMVQPKLADGKPGEGAFWKDFDWTARRRARAWRSSACPTAGSWATSRPR